MTITVTNKGGVPKVLEEGIDYIVRQGEVMLTFPVGDIDILEEKPSTKIQKPIILGTKLSIENQNYILGDLFGFYVDKAGVVYDDDGEEFYKYAANNAYDLSTLAGIFKYAQAISFKKGANDIIYKLNKLLIPQ